MVMDRLMFEQSCVIIQVFCVKLGESATVMYERLQRGLEYILYPGYDCSGGTSPF
jgi:hypothetical protein